MKKLITKLFLYLHQPHISYREKNLLWDLNEPMTLPFTTVKRYAEKSCYSEKDTKKMFESMVTKGLLERSGISYRITDKGRAELYYYIIWTNRNDYE